MTFLLIVAGVIVILLVAGFLFVAVGALLFGGTDPYDDF